MLGLDRTVENKCIANAKAIENVKCERALIHWNVVCTLLSCQFTEYIFCFNYCYFSVQVVEVNTSFDSEGTFEGDIEDDDDQSEQFSESIEQEVEQEHAYIVMEGPDHDEMGHAM